MFQRRLYGSGDVSVVGDLAQRCPFLMSDPFRTSFDSCVYVEDSVLSLANGNKAARSRQSHQALGDGTRNNCRGIDLPIAYHLPLLVGRLVGHWQVRGQI